MNYGHFAQILAKSGIPFCGVSYFRSHFFVLFSETLQHLGAFDEPATRPNSYKM